MIYQNIKKAKFISRPNRFIANIEIDGKAEICHVKNTGRCKELLTPNADILVQYNNNTSRKTKYDLISVYKGDRLINMDSQVPNKVLYEFLLKSDLFKNIIYIKPECKYKNSRFDFYLETKSKKVFIEVKGVTLEEDGVVLFPDAPTQRGLKHINELIECAEEGFDAYIVFVVQMKNVKYFTPNYKTHAAFGEALKLAKNSGVKIIALDCSVTETSIEICDFLEVIL